MSNVNNNPNPVSPQHPLPGTGNPANEPPGATNQVNIIPLPATPIPQTPPAGLGTNHEVTVITPSTGEASPPLRQRRRLLPNINREELSQTTLFTDPPIGNPPTPPPDSNSSNG